MAVRTMQRSRGPTEYNLASTADPGRRDPTTERGAAHTVLFLIGLCVPTHARAHAIDVHGFCRCMSLCVCLCVSACVRVRVASLAGHNAIVTPGCC